MKRNFKRFWKLGREEFNTQYFDITPNGELMLKEGNYQYNLAKLAKQYGTSLEVMFPFIVESRLRQLTDFFNAYIKLNDYKGKFYYHYPMKVNQHKQFVLSVVSEGANLETSSANELWIVKKLWEQERFNSKIRVLCNGPKNIRYVQLIDELNKKGLTITPIAEHQDELDAFKKFKSEIGLRVNLNVKVKSHWDKKFQYFGLPEEEVLRLPKVPNLGILSYHISSQVDRLDGLVDPVKRIFIMYAKLRQRNPKLDTIDIGGGGAVPYTKKSIYTVKAAAQRIVKACKQMSQKYNVREPNIICEWGRYVVAPAQVTLFKALTEKPVENGSNRKWYIVDGSFMNDLPDTWTIHQQWHAVPANNMMTRHFQRTWLAGSSCDSDDKYTAQGTYILLPRLTEDSEQYIAFFDTGAYQDSLGATHCLLANPTKIIAHNGELKVAAKRQSAEELGKQFGW
jgi:arginine decarboxylase